MDNVLINSDDNIRITELPSTRVNSDPNIFISENIVQGGEGATIAIGTVETLPPDDLSYVTNVGTPQHAIFNFGLVRGQNGRDGLDGVDGLDGSDGFSPIATVEETEDGAIISITDATETTTATIYNGQNGTDGVSPIATVTPITNGVQISVTDADGTTTENVYNGTDGSDGISPIATVTQNTGSATISITDLNGTTTATVYDGQDGSAGQAATITVGSTTTGNAGTNASVTNSGTTSAAVLDFVIPRGADGQGFIDYSTSEVETGLKWIDGSTIYRRVFSGSTTISANTDNTINTGVSAKSIINAYGYFDSWHSGSNYNRVAFGQYNGNNIYSSAMIRNASTIELHFISSIAVNSEYAVVVEYIK